MKKGASAPLHMFTKDDIKITSEFTGMYREF